MKLTDTDKKVLATLDEARDTLTRVQIAEALTLRSTTVVLQRLQVLENAGYVLRMDPHLKQDRDTRKWGLTLRGKIALDDAA